MECLVCNFPVAGLIYKSAWSWSMDCTKLLRLVGDLESQQVGASWLHSNEKHAPAPVFTLNCHVRSHIGHALEPRAVTSLQRFVHALRRVRLTATTTRMR
ncbi:hypothetical protein [Burkholderia sp. AU6039]|uniref:hypothetical protein n=1 Tax=Burkholderia sp. AU6039 TaxID=2015344 RepID=UPI0011809026|nr:hypothetical protein [Burkholderia sp. AU6039]